MVTIFDVAREARVSKSTVSRVILGGENVHPETRARILEAIKKLNYYPQASARALVQNKTYTIGLVIPHNPNFIFADPFFPQVMRGISNVGCEKGYNILLSTTLKDTPEESIYFKLVNSKRVDGLILLSTPIGDPFIEKLDERGFPFVMIGHRPGPFHDYYVDADNVGGGRLAAEYLLSKGHRKVGTITGPINHIASRDRLEGFRQALEEKGVILDPKWIREGDFTQESGYALAKGLLQEGSLPTAIFAQNDMMAIGAMKAFQEAGLSIPQDIALMGFDDTTLAQYTNPSLTTIRQPMYQLGAEAMKMLIEVAEKGEADKKQVILEVELIRRGSA